jgi:hypothetical protein
MVHEWRSLSDIRAMVRDGEFADAHSVAALTLYDLAAAADPPDTNL